MDFEMGIVLTFGALGVLLGLMLLNSFGITWPGQAFDVYQFGTYVCTYWPRKAEEFLDEDQIIRYNNLKDSNRVRAAWFMNIVFALWPFYQLRRIPTGTVTSEQHATDVFTKGTANHVRLELSAKPTFTGSFISLAGFRQRMGLPFSGNWVESCTATDPSGKIKYETNKFGEWFGKRISQLYLEVFRQVAATFVWHDEGPKIAGEEDVAGEKLLLERMTLWQLSAPESILTQAKVLKRPDHLLAFLKTNVGKNENSSEFLALLVTCPVALFCGPYTLSIDLNLADLDLALEADNASEAQKAVNAPFVGKQRAKAAQFVGEAEAQVIRAKGQANADAAKALQKNIVGSDPATLAALQLLREGHVTFNTLGTTIPDILRSFGGAKT